MDRFDPPPSEAEYTVVGGGIVGLAVARQILADYPGSRLAVLEGENRLAAHQTSHSSGVIHAGVYYSPGSLKARLCSEGRRELIAYCEEHGIHWSKNGKLIVATDGRELAALDRLDDRARSNGVPGLRRLAASEIPSVEPYARGLAALHSPETGVVDFGAVAARLAADVEEAGGTIHLGCAVAGVTGSRPGSSSGSRSGSGRDLALTTARGRMVSRATVFCGGLQADRLARMCGVTTDIRIVPFRGGYARLRPERAGLVRGNIYPVPDPDLPFLGAHLTRTVEGSVLIGPTAMPVASRHGYRLLSWDARDAIETASWPGTWRLATRHPRAAAREVRRTVSRRILVADARRMVPGLTAADVVPGPAGVRAQALDRAGNLVDDFVVERSETSVHVLNAPSPAATSALALARLIASRLPA